MRIEEREGKLVIVDFSELEACKIAAKVEADGIRFYTTLVEKVEDESVKQSITFLLDAEQKHLVFFERRITELGARIDDGFEDDDLALCMDAGVFQPYQQMSQMKETIHDVGKALDLGITIEERTILFYEQCLQLVTSAAAKKQLQEIIEEEKQHKKLFESMKG